MSHRHFFFAWTFQLDKSSYINRTFLSSLYLRVLGSSHASKPDRDGEIDRLVEPCSSLTGIFTNLLLSREKVRGKRTPRSVYSRAEPLTEKDGSMKAWKIMANVLFLRQRACSHKTELGGSRPVSYTHLTLPTIYSV